MIRRLAAVAAAGMIGGALVLTGTAHAHHNVPDLIVGDVGDCGEVTFESHWTAGDEHLVGNATLVVDVDGEVQTAPIGESITVGPFDAPDVTIHYRVWGGGERDYDVPLWNGYGEADFIDDIVAYATEVGDGEEDYSWTTAGVDDPNPFVTWFELEVEGCPIPVTPVEPTITASGECEVADTLNIPEVEGVVYTVAPEYTEGATGTFEVTATAEEGYELKGETSWKLTIDEPDKCPAPKPDEEEPKDEAEKKDEEKLAATGAPLQLMIGAGLLLLAGGGAAMAMARRRGIV